MKKLVLALPGAGLALAASTAQAQSLSDAINTALAADASGNTCAALGGASPRFLDTYISDDSFDPSPEVTITNGETTLITTRPPPVIVGDGTGRDFSVQPSNFPSLDPTVAQNLTEDELLALFTASGVQFLSVSRFAAAAFAPGLAGLCQRVFVRTNSNGNSAGAGGFAGGSSSASGRSISSLSSAREQSSKEKKRKKKKDRNAGKGDGYVRLASNDGGVGVIADAAGVGPFGVATFLDFRAGYTDIDRDATALESGFDGRSVWGQGSLTAEVTPHVALSGSFAYSRARGEFDGSTVSGGANTFAERSYTGSLFAIGAIPLSGNLDLDLAVGGFFGSGSGDIARTFATTRETTYALDVFIDPANPGAGDRTLNLARTSIVSDDLAGGYDTRHYGFSAAASVSIPVGAFTLTPGVEFTHLTFRQDGYEESATDAFNNGLALSYAEFQDRWTETRLGGALSRSFGRVRLEGYGDLVLTGGAATPTRQATFVEDLRAEPFVLNYQIDDLDSSFAVLGFVAGFSVGDGIEAFVGGETNVAHDYLQTRTIFAGVRVTP